MEAKEPAYPQVFKKSVRIEAPVSDVWQALINTELMKEWMLDEELSIVTDWKPGHPFLIRGKLHDMEFENKGLVLQYEFEKAVCYTQLSSISELPDIKESYSVTEFWLTPGSVTLLELTVSNFPTEVIYRHLIFYWAVTLEVIKKFVETHLTIQHTQ